MPTHLASTAQRPDPGDSGDSAAGGQASAGNRVAVLLPLPLPGPYTYRVPAELVLSPGDLVQVPLGARHLYGAVWDAAELGDLPDSRLKAVIDRLPVPPIPEVQRRFVDWVAGYTLSPPGLVLRMVLSVSSALEPPRPQRLLRAAIPRQDGARLTPARRRVLEVAGDGLVRPAAELAREAGVSAAVVKALVDTGYLEWIERPVEIAFPEPDWRRAGVALSQDQDAAARHLKDTVRAGGFSATLLDGVTGSGKTEVYFEAIAAALEAGQQVLVLQPEIALTSQWLERFENRFGVRPAEWHSDLTQRQRRRTWRAVAEGLAPVVVGARSALFLPFPRLGLLIVDEEHDGAYKQEDGVIYQARDMAVVRARLGAIPVVLASATPSLESVLNLQAGKYRGLHLPDRHGSAGMPEIRLVDLRREPPPRRKDGGQGWLSTPLRAALQETLEAGEQALLFLNRRGYAPLTLCRVCGHRFECPNCTAWLVEHRFVARLQCHHCGYGQPLPQVCPACNAEDSLVGCGPGIERLDEEAAELFPDARRLLLSSDVIAGPAAAEALLQSIRNHEVDLVIGTQVVAKGHHFPMLTCVGVVDADLGLNGGDLRAGERTYHLLHQVAGRAGRAERPGKVWLQTYDPDHPVMRALAGGERDRFLEAEAAIRRQGFLPPYCRMAALIIAGRDAARADAAAARLARAAPRLRGLEVLGPAPAPLAVLRGWHRRRMLVKAERSLPLQRILRDWLGAVELPSGLRLAVDIDPYSFM